MCCRKSLMVSQVHVQHFHMTLHWYVGATHMSCTHPSAKGASDNLPNQEYRGIECTSLTPYLDSSKSLALQHTSVLHMNNIYGLNCDLVAFKWYGRKERATFTCSSMDRAIDPF